MSAGLGFPDTIVGGIFLLIPAIRSPNYSPGVTGWTVNQDGSAEFNDLTVRGTFAGNDFIIDSAGLFVYSGVPAAGNLAISVASAAGTDGFGNAYPAGLKLFTGQLTIADPAAIQFPSGASFEQGIARILSNTGGVAPAQFISTEITSASTTGANAHDSVLASFNSAAQDNSSSANMDLVYVHSNGNVSEYAFMDQNGFTVLAGSIVAADPGTTPAVPAVWHTIPLVNGYTAGTNNGFTDVPQVRLMADNKTLGFKGALTVPAAPASNVWGTLPAGFPNANFGGPFGLGSVSNFTGGVTDHVQVQNNANLSLGNGTAHGGSTFSLCCQVPTQ